MPYFVAAFISAFFGWLASQSKSKLSRSFFLALGVTPFCYLAAFRALNVGADTSNYPYYLTVESQSMSLFELVQRHSMIVEGGGASIEPLYVIMVWFTARLTGSFHTVLGVSQLMVVIPVIVAIIKLCPRDIGKSMLIYALMFFPLSLNMVRQSIGDGFVLLAVSLYLKEDKKGALKSTIIGMLFHTSALMGLIAIGLVWATLKAFERGSIDGFLGMKVSSALTIIGAFAAALLFVVFGNLLLPYLSVIKDSYSLMMTHAGEAGMSGSSLFVAGSAIACYAIWHRDISRDEKMMRVTAAILMLVLYGGITGQLAIISSALGRIGIIFLQFSILLFPWVCSQVSEASRRMALTVFLIAVASTYFIGCWVPTELVPYEFAGSTWAVSTFM